MFFEKNTWFCLEFYADFNHVIFNKKQIDRKMVLSPPVLYTKSHNFRGKNSRNQIWEGQEKMENLKMNSRKIRLRIQIEMKMGEKKNKNDIKKRKFGKFTQNFTSLEEKIPTIGIQMTGENAEFQCEFEQKIQIEVKMREKTNQHLEEKNFTSLDETIH